MTFEEIYNRIIPLWSDTIEFEDSKQEPKNAIDTPGTKPSGGEYFYSKKLNNQWDNVERIVGTEDSFGDLMVWTMFQIFSQKARKLAKNGTYSFNPTEIDKDEIEKQYFENLQGNTWEEELLAYERKK